MVKVGTLYKKSVLRDLGGNIINLRDETDGGWIIQNRIVVNQAKYDELVKKEKDRQEAARAEAEAIAAPPGAVEARTGNPSKVDALEKKVAGMEDNIKEILSLLKNDNRSN